MGSWETWGWAMGRLKLLRAVRGIELVEIENLENGAAGLVERLP